MNSVRFTYVATLLVSALFTGACGTQLVRTRHARTHAMTLAPAKWMTPVSMGCDLVTRDEAAKIFGVTWDDVDPIDAGISEHRDGGLMGGFKRSSQRHCVGASIAVRGRLLRASSSRALFSVGC